MGPARLFQCDIDCATERYKQRKQGLMVSVLTRTGGSLRPDQDQRHRQEVRADDLHSRLVRAGRREAVPAASAGLGDAVVQEPMPKW
jgi:hypothetical protein